VDGGAPNRQPYAYDKPEDKSHCPFSLLMVRHDAFGRGRADPPLQSLPYAKISLSNHTRLHVAGTCPIQRLFDPEIRAKIRN
jgi:hypothetical protein